jgi:hypothetical protein
MSSRQVKGLAFGKKEEGMEVSLRQSHLKDWLETFEVVGDKGG